MAATPLLIARYALHEALGLVFMAVALFWSAGTIRWWPAWAALGVMAAWVVATAVVLLRLHPDLLIERLGPRPGAKAWDKAIVSLLGLVQLAKYVVAGLDERHGWTPEVPPGVRLVALAVCALSYAAFVWAIAVNAYFTQVVRLQPERGQTVVAEGPYRFVRHPAYLGAVAYELASPVLLGSAWSGIGGVVGAAMLVLRTALEDRTLRAELPGYAEYAARVRHRLLPGVW